MSIIEAVKGAHADISSLARPIDKLARLGTYIRVLGAEVLGMVTVIPYGLRAFALHRSLPASPPHRGTRPPSTLVSLARAIPYGPGPRNAIDIYLPCVPDMHGEHEDDIHPTIKRPVMLFVHGGVWAAGERFHYAPMAVRCAQAGIITAVMSYTLYPEAKVPTMVDEVGAALDWTLENISTYGGDPSRLILVGHSAGAQLSALTLIQRSVSVFTNNNKGMPCAFVGMAGVYNIKEHYQYEKARQVHKLSTMERAVGGPDSFDEASPVIVLRDSLRRPSSRNFKNSKPRGLPIWLKRLKLHGDALSSRIGLLSAESVLGSDDFASFPPTVLMASCSDTTVPWYESADMFGACQQCGIPAKLLVYNRVGHGDFVVNWHPSLAPDASSHCHKDLEYYTSDLVNILLSS